MHMALGDIGDSASLCNVKTNNYLRGIHFGVDLAFLFLARQHN